MLTKKTNYIRTNTLINTRTGIVVNKANIRGYKTLVANNRIPYIRIRTMELRTITGINRAIRTREIKGCGTITTRIPIIRSLNSNVEIIIEIRKIARIYNRYTILTNIIKISNITDIKNKTITNYKKPKS